MTDDSDRKAPVQVTGAHTLTITAYNVESGGKITVTLDGDVSTLLPHITRLVVEAVEGMNDDG